MALLGAVGSGLGQDSLDGRSHGPSLELTGPAAGVCTPPAHGLAVAPRAGKGREKAEANHPAPPAEGAGGSTERAGPGALPGSTSFSFSVESRPGTWIQVRHPFHEGSLKMQHISVPGHSSLCKTWSAPQAGGLCQIM